MSKSYQPFSNRSLSDWIAQLQQPGDADQRLSALQAVGVLGNPVERAHWSCVSLCDSDPTIRAFAAKLAGDVQVPLSDDAGKQLITLLDDTDPDVRFESARALIRQKSDQSNRTVPALLAFLDEPETHALMIAAVINVLAEIEMNTKTAETEFRPRLLKWLEHERAEVREAISTAFAKWPLMASSCPDRLLPLLDDSEPLVREKIAETFGEAGIVSEQIRSALTAARDDEDTEVARAATDALQKLDVRTERKR